MKKEKNEPEISETSVKPSVVINNHRIENPLLTTSTKSCGCGGMSNNNPDGIISSPSYIYAIGKVIHRFPNKSVEMELTQTISRIPEGETKSLNNPEVAHKVLTDPNNRYLARQICYILTIEGLEGSVKLSSKNYS